MDHDAQISVIVLFGINPFAFTSVWEIIFFYTFRKIYLTFDFRNAFKLLALSLLLMFVAKFWNREPIISDSPKVSVQVLDETRKVRP